MSYEIDSITEKQAEAIIGKKMMHKIRLINSWLANYGFKVYFHRTTLECVDGIFKTGLTHYRSTTYNDPMPPEEILETTSVSEKELRMLGDWARQHKGQKGTLKKDYEAMVDISRDTTRLDSAISASRLLVDGVGHGPVTIVLVVPKDPKIFSKPQDMFRQLKNIPYLRTHISCESDEVGDLEYTMRYFYPTQAILFAFDDTRLKMRYNNDFDETYFLSPTSRKRMILRKGGLVKSLREIDARSLDEDGGER